VENEVFKKPMKVEGVPFEGKWGPEGKDEKRKDGGTSISLKCIICK
jgi:hypothetical protein